MFTCRICQFETELDDVVVAHGWRCICLRCYGRATESSKIMSKDLRLMLVAALEAVPAQ